MVALEVAANATANATATNGGANATAKAKGGAGGQGGSTNSGNGGAAIAVANATGSTSGSATATATGGISTNGGGPNSLYLAATAARRARPPTQIFQMAVRHLRLQPAEMAARPLEWAISRSLAMGAATQTPAQQMADRLSPLRSAATAGMSMALVAILLELETGNGCGERNSYFNCDAGRLARPRSQQRRRSWRSIVINPITTIHRSGRCWHSKRQLIRYDDKRQYGPSAVHRRPAQAGRHRQLRRPISLLELGSNYGHESSWRHSSRQCSRPSRSVLPSEHDQCRAKFFGRKCFRCRSFDDCVWFDGSRWRHWCVAHLSNERQFRIQRNRWRDILD